MKQMIKRKDGSVSQRGLWDNIRANKGSGKKPTAAMLKQEKKIKAKGVKKAQNGNSMFGGPAPISLIPAAGAVKSSKTKERSDDGNYVKVTKTRETPSGTKTVTKTRRTAQGVYKLAPRVANYKKGGSVKKDDKWIQKAVNPKHKGYCTPMTKATCTPKRKALAMTFKKMAKARKGK